MSINNLKVAAGGAAAKKIERKGGLYMAKKKATPIAVMFDGSGGKIFWLSGGHTAD